MSVIARDSRGIPEHSVEMEPHIDQHLGKDGIGQMHAGVLLMFAHRFMIIILSIIAFFDEVAKFILKLG